MSWLRTLALLLLFAPGLRPLHAQSWQMLFDGQSFAGWTNQKGEAVSAPGWEVVDGMLHLDRSRGAGGNLLTERSYRDFELVFEWTVAPGANNGIKYRVRDFEGRVLGIEYQVIDDAAHPKLSPDHRTASLYDIYPAKEHHVLRPAGEFNRGRIRVFQGRIEHWLNGHLITAAHVGSPEWQERIAASKFANVEGFGTSAEGRIMLTDHKDEVWYRNIFIRELNCPPRQAPVCCRRPRRWRWWRR